MKKKNLIPIQGRNKFEIGGFVACPTTFLANLVADQNCDDEMLEELESTLKDMKPVQQQITSQFIANYRNKNVEAYLGQSSGIDGVTVFNCFSTREDQENTAIRMFTEDMAIKYAQQKGLTDCISYDAGFPQLKHQTPFKLYVNDDNWMFEVTDQKNLFYTKEFNRPPKLHLHNCNQAIRLLKWKGVMTLEGMKYSSVGPSIEKHSLGLEYGD